MSLFAVLGGYGTESPTFNISVSPPSLYGARIGPGTVMSSLATVNVSGGTPPYTYVWTPTGVGDSMDIVQSGNVVRFTAFIDLVPQSLTGLFNLTVTDSKGATGALTNYNCVLETKLGGGGLEP